MLDAQAMDSKGPIEVALSTDLRGSPYNFSLWDIHSGVQLVAFKGNKGNPIPKCLQIIDGDYFLTVTDNMIQIWSIFNRKCQDHKLFLPSRPSSLCISPCGNYLIAGISEMIYIWQLYSGNLLAHTQRHYQTVTVLKMNSDGTFLFSGGEDGIVLVWAFADLISNTHNTGALNLSQARNDVGVNEPRFTLQHHSAQVTDIHVTNGDLCLTVSLDKTINIYSYSNGRRLHCIELPSPIFSVVMNKNETRAFLGAQDGNIYEVSLSSLSLSLINSPEKDNESSKKPLFVGHKDKVTHLLVSMDGTQLISGSLDCTCKIWDIHKKKMLRDIKHQAPLANLVSLIVPDAFSLTSLAQSQVKPPLLLKPLKRSLLKISRDTTIMSNDIFEDANTTVIHVKNRCDHWTNSLTEITEQPPDQLYLSCSSNGQLNGDDKQNSHTVEVTDDNTVSETSNETVQALKTKLRDLYVLSVQKVFKDAAHESLEPFKQVAHDIMEILPIEPKKDPQKGKRPKRKKMELNVEELDPLPSTNGLKKVKN